MPAAGAIMDNASAYIIKLNPIHPMKFMTMRAKRITQYTNHLRCYRLAFELSAYSFELLNAYALRFS